MNRAEEKVYFAISGKNGFAVYTDEEKLRRGKEFLSSPTIVKCKTEFEAFKEAIEIYNEWQDDFDAAYFGGIGDLRLNWMVFRREIVKKNMEYVNG